MFLLVNLDRTRKYCVIQLYDTIIDLVENNPGVTRKKLRVTMNHK